MAAVFGENAVGAGGTTWPDAVRIELRSDVASDPNPKKFNREKTPQEAESAINCLSLAAIVPTQQSSGSIRLDLHLIYISMTCWVFYTTAPIGVVDNFHTTFRFFLPDSLDRGIPILTANCVRHVVRRQNDQEP